LKKLFKYIKPAKKMLHPFLKKKDFQQNAPAENFGSGSLASNLILIKPADYCAVMIPNFWKLSDFEIVKISEGRD